LQKHEMPILLLKNLAKYSREKDRVNFQEFLQFSRDRDFPSPPVPEAPKNMETTPRPGPAPPIQIEQPDLEARPIVYRAGNLPRGSPDSLKRLALDEAGQISLYEGRKAGKPLNEFALWDRNDDGLITFEEVLQKLDEALQKPREGRARRKRPPPPPPPAGD